MLVVDLSLGACDVCFGGFDGEPGCGKAPHTIPCGHVFCKECLVTVMPRKCPLCRHPFALQTIRKIFVQKLKAPESVEVPPPEKICVLPEKDEEMELVRRYLESLEADKDEPLLQVIGEITEFLNSGKESSTIARVFRLKRQVDTLKSKHRKHKEKMGTYEDIVKELRSLRVEESRFHRELETMRRQAVQYQEYIEQLQDHITVLERIIMGQEEVPIITPPSTPEDLFHGLVKALWDAVEMSPTTLEAEIEGEKHSVSD